VLILGHHSKPYNFVVENFTSRTFLQPCSNNPSDSDIILFFFATHDNAKIARGVAFGLLIEG
jgi:hypothetical protein